MRLMLGNCYIHKMFMWPNIEKLCVTLYFCVVENRIRHVPVIDGKIVGMISIVDVVRAVTEQQDGELKRLGDYIRGEYY